MMIDTKLILIEGLPGSGKSTTAQYLADEIAGDDHDCVYYHELASDHPIYMDLGNRLSEEISSPVLRELALVRWELFASTLQPSSPIHIIDSRLWQNTTLLAYLAGEPVEAVVRNHQRVIDHIQASNPVFIYLDQDDTVKAMNRTFAFREPAWGQRVIEVVEHQKWAVDRGLKGRKACLAALSEWVLVADQLYEQFPCPKIKIMNPHENWEQVYRDIKVFLEMDS